MYAMKSNAFSQPLQHDAADFWQLFKTSTCAVQRRRAQFFALLAEGRSLPDLLALTRYSRVSAYTLLARYHAQGLDGLVDARHGNTGAPTLLTPDEQQRMALRLHQDFEQGIVWSGKDLQHWIQTEFGKDVYLGRTYEFMRAAGFSPQKPRPQHVGGDEAAKEAFKTKS